ncbi:MAG: YigZ family protein, partial [Eubacterium sp.]|nr:YigZ family protein [Eubacterium sp.]
MAENQAYYTIYKGGTGEVVEKKSRFIGETAQVTDEEQAAVFVEGIRKKFYDARHHCFAYVIGADGKLMRAADDGEPQGTAGKPMLEVLTGRGLANTIVVVTRYFGGTLLGTGGLVRCY